MSDRIKKIKVKKADGSMTDYIPIGADAENIDTADGESVEIKLNKKPYYYNSVADMKADNKLKAGDMAITLGYYSVNDGGKAEYKIRIIGENEIADEMIVLSLNNNTLVAEIIIDEFVNINQLGAKENNLSFDNLDILETAISNFDKISLNGGVYYIDDIINLNSLSNKIIDGKNSTIKGKGFADSNVGNTGLLNITSCSNISIDNLLIDGDIEWISRPYPWEDGHSIYSALRNKTYDGFRIYNSNDININKCKATKIKVGYHFSGCSNCSVDNSESTYTMADGVLIHGGCSAIRVSNHYVEYGNDDQFSMVHETHDTNYVKNCSYINCKAINSFGACCVMQECIKCYASNCSSINNRDVPFKMGTTFGTFACSDCTMDNIKVESQNTISGTNADLSTAQSNGSMSIAYTSGMVSLNDCVIKNSSFIEKSGNNLSLFNPNHSGLKFENCLFDGINIILVDINDTLFDKCIIKSHDGNTLTRSSVTFRNCEITDDLTYSTRGNRALSCNNCHDIILDNVKLTGHNNLVTQNLSFYSDDTSYSTAYVDVNETNINIINMVDIYKNGVLKLSDINKYGYQRFREGQLVYFESNDGLYLIHGTGWTKLN